MPDDSLLHCALSLMSCCLENASLRKCQADCADSANFSCENLPDCVNLVSLPESRACIRQHFLIGVLSFCRLLSPRLNMSFQDCSCTPSAIGMLALQCTWMYDIHTCTVRGCKQLSLQYYSQVLCVSRHDGGLCLFFTTSICSDFMCIGCTKSATQQFQKKSK